MSEKELKVGDRVRVAFLNGNTMIGHVAEIKWNGWCDIDFGDGCMAYDVTQDRIRKVEPLDPKTAFLTELSELLRKYDAKIDTGYYGFDGENPILSVTLGDDSIEWTQGSFNKDFRFPLTADNVLNYDKE